MSKEELLYYTEQLRRDIAMETDCTKVNAMIAKYNEMRDYYISRFYREKEEIPPLDI